MAEPEATVARKKRSYDASFKLKVIDYAISQSNRAAARHFGIDEKRVREWKKQRDDLQMLPQKKRLNAKWPLSALVQPRLLRREGVAPRSYIAGHANKRRPRIDAALE